MTYADGGEDILELVDEGDQARVIDIYAKFIASARCGFKSARAQEPYAVGFAVMVCGVRLSDIAEFVGQVGGKAKQAGRARNYARCAWV